jgi:hypothetical protein
MDAWLTEFYELFVYSFGRATLAETYILILLSVLFGALALSRISRRLGAPGAFYITGVLLTSIGLVVIVAALSVLPFLSFHAWWMILAMPCAAILLVVVPLTMLFQKGRYGTSLIAWIMTLLVIAVVLILEPRAMRSVQKSFEKAMQNGLRLQQHRVQTEQLK